MMLYDFQTQRWSELAHAFGSVAWSHDNRFVYLHLKHAAEPAELVRISVPGGKVERVLDLTGVTLGGLWPDWISLLPDDSPCSCWTEAPKKSTDSNSSTDDFKLPFCRHYACQLLP